MHRAWARPIFLILIAVAALYLVGNDRVDLWDRDEPRYAQTSRQMLAGENWVVPVLLDKVRTAKPVFIYWCQAASMRLWDIDPGQTPVARMVWAARFPSAIAMLLTLGIVGAVLARSVGPRRAVWTVFILATAGLTIAAAKMCITDSVLLLWITIAQLCLAGVYLGRASWGVVVTMWLAFGLAALTKGPVVLGVQLTTMFVLAAFDVAGAVRRDGARGWRAHLHWGRWSESIAWWRRTRPLPGLLMVACIVGPWLYLVEQRSPGFLYTTLSHDVMTRTLKPLEGHKGPPGFYLASVWVTFFPWCLLLPTATTLAWKNRRLSPIRFAMAAVLGPWLMMEFVQTKLVHYVMPAFPPLAFLTADALVRCIRKQHDDLHRPIMRWVAGAWGVAVIAAGFLPWLLVRRFEHSGTLTLITSIFSIAGIAYAAAVYRRIRLQRLSEAALAMGGGMILVIAIFYGLWLPEARFLWLPKQVAAILNRHGATGRDDVVMIDFKEDSLPVYQDGNTIRPRDDDFLAITPPEHWPTWVVLTRDIAEDSRWLPPERRGLLEVVGTAKGLAYADGGRTIEVIVARTRSPGARPR